MCGGDGSEFCGGANLLQLYELSGPASSGAFGPSNSAGGVVASGSAGTDSAGGPGLSGSTGPVSMSPMSPASGAVQSPTGTGSGFGSSSSSTATPTAGGQTFQLYAKSNMPGINDLPIGERAGDVTVGAHTAIVWTINSLTNMSDPVGNYVYFSPGSATAKRVKRQDTAIPLRYGPDPPADSISSGFMLNYKSQTLQSNTSRGYFTFYTLSDSSQEQDVYVAPDGNVPPGGYAMDLVTTPPPLNSSGAANSGSSPSNTAAGSSGPSGTSNGAASGLSGSPSPTSSGAPSVVPSAGGYDDQGLYDDDPSNPILGTNSTSSPTMTVAGCASICSGSPYFGVENGRFLVR